MAVVVAVVIQVVYLHPFEDKGEGRWKPRYDHGGARAREEAEKIGEGRGKAADNRPRPSQEAAQRPGAGVQDPFTGRKRPKAYRYESSLDPQLSRE